MKILCSEAKMEEIAACLVDSFTYIHANRGEAGVTQCSAELKKIAILAIRIGERFGNLGNILTKNLRTFVDFWDMSQFTYY